MFCQKGPKWSQNEFFQVLLKNQLVEFIFCIKFQEHKVLKLIFLEIFFSGVFERKSRCFISDQLTTNFSGSEKKIGFVECHRKLFLPFSF